MSGWHARRPGPGRRGRRTSRARRWALRGLLALVLVVSVLLIAGHLRGPSRAVTRPNIVFISTDDLRVRDLRVMPNVKALITDRGTNFTTSYVPFPLCCPSRASWLTGQYNHNNGVMGNLTSESPVGGYHAMDHTNTVVTWLRSAGYQTAYVGRYLNGYGTVRPIPVPPGWQDWHAVVGPNDYFKTNVLENTTGTLQITTYSGPYQVDLVGSIANTVIRNRVPRAAPLFLWVSQFAPHNGGPAEPDDPPLGTPAVPPRFKDAYADTPLPEDPSYDEADVSDKPADVRDRPLLTPTLQTHIKELNAQRWESLRAVDESVRSIVDTLRATGELDNTVIVFSSDNGYMLGEHRVQAGKIVPYEASSRVPLIIRGPGFPAGAVRRQLVANIDLAPTLADLANTRPGRLVDGRSLLPLSSSPGTWPARNLALEAGPIEVGGPDSYHGARTDRYKYIRYSTGERELYDLVDDPDELTNLVDDPAYDATEAVLDDMTTRLQGCQGTSDCW